MLRSPPTRTSDPVLVLSPFAPEQMAVAWGTHSSEVFMEISHQGRLGLVHPQPEGTLRATVRMSMREAPVTLLAASPQAQLAAVVTHDSESHVLVADAAPLLTGADDAGEGRAVGELALSSPADVCAMAWAGDGAGLLVADVTGLLSMLAPSPWAPLWRFSLASPAALNMLAAGTTPHEPALAGIRGLSREFPVITPAPPRSPHPPAMSTLRHPAPVLEAAWTPAPIDDPSQPPRMSVSVGGDALAITADGEGDADGGGATPRLSIDLPRHGAGAGLAGLGLGVAGRRGTGALATLAANGEVRVWVKVAMAYTGEEAEGGDSGAAAGEASPATPAPEWVTALVLNPAEQVPPGITPAQCHLSWVQPVEAGRLPGVQDVWWIALTLPAPPQRTTPALPDAPSPAPPSHPSPDGDSELSRILLWAVQGLSHIAMPPSHARSSHRAPRPRVAFWGCYALGGGGAMARARPMLHVMYQLAAPHPVIEGVVVAAGGASGSAALGAYAIDTVADRMRPQQEPDTPTTPDPSPLPVPCPSASLTAHAAPVACLALAPSSPSDVTRPCASVDEGGHAIVWDVGSMSALAESHLPSLAPCLALTWAGPAAIAAITGHPTPTLTLLSHTLSPTHAAPLPRPSDVFMNEVNNAAWAVMDVAWRARDTDGACDRGSDDDVHCEGVVEVLVASPAGRPALLRGVVDEGRIQSVTGVAMAVGEAGVVVAGAIAGAGVAVMVVVSNEGRGAAGVVVRESGSACGVSPTLLAAESVKGVAVNGGLVAVCGAAGGRAVLQVLAVSPCPGHLLSLATEYPPGPDATAVAWLPALSAPTVAVCCGTRVHLYALTCDARLEYLGGVEMPGGARVLAAGGCGVVVGACRDGVVAAQCPSRDEEAAADAAERAAGGDHAEGQGRVRWGGAGTPLPASSPHLTLPEALGADTAAAFLAAGMPESAGAVLHAAMAALGMGGDDSDEDNDGIGDDDGWPGVGSGAVLAGAGQSMRQRAVGLAERLAAAGAAFEVATVREGARVRAGAVAKDGAASEHVVSDTPKQGAAVDNNAPSPSPSPSPSPFPANPMVSGLLDMSAFGAFFGDTVAGNGNGEGDERSSEGEGGDSGGADGANGANGDGVMAHTSNGSAVTTDSQAARLRVTLRPAPASQPWTQRGTARLAQALCRAGVVRAADADRFRAGAAVAGGGWSVGRVGEGEDGGGPAVDPAARSRASDLGLSSRDAHSLLRTAAAVASASALPPLDPPARHLLCALLAAHAKSPTEATSHAPSAPRGFLSQSSQARWELLAGHSLGGKQGPGTHAASHAGSDGDMQAAEWGLAPGLAWADVAAAAQSGAGESLASAVAVLAAEGRVPGVAQGTPPDGWPAMRAAGAGLWMRDVAALAAWAERAARSHFAASRDPSRSALLLVALRRPRVLAGLYKAAGQPRQAEFFARDFSDPNARLAAEKNAYAVLSRHDYETSAALFLLAGGLGDAVDVLAGAGGDPQLAAVVARLWGGEEGARQEARVMGRLRGAAAEAAAAMGAARAAEGAWAGVADAGAVLRQWRAAVAAGEVGLGWAREGAGALAAAAEVAAESGRGAMAAACLGAAAAVARGAGAGCAAGAVGRAAGRVAYLAAMDPNCELGEGVVKGSGLAGRVLGRLEGALWAAVAGDAGPSDPFLSDALRHARTRALALTDAAAATLAARIRRRRRARHAHLAGASSASFSTTLSGWAEPVVHRHLPPLRAFRCVALREPLLSARLSSSTRPGDAPPLLARCSAGQGLTVTEMPQQAREAWDHARRLLSSHMVRSASFFQAVQGMFLNAASKSPAGSFKSNKSPAGSFKSSPHDPHHTATAPSTPTTPHHSHAHAHRTTTANHPHSPHSHLHPHHSHLHRASLGSTLASHILGTATPAPTDPFAPHRTPTVRAARLLTSALESHPSEPILATGASGARAALWRFESGQGREASGVLAFHTPSEAERPRFAQDPFAQVACVAFSRCGQSVAGILETGTCAVWSVEAGVGSYARGGVHASAHAHAYATDASPAVPPLWSHRCFSRRGAAVSFLGASSTVLLTAGLGQQGRTVAAWDTGAPQPQPAAVLAAHAGACRCLCASSSTVVFYTGGADGVVAAWDMRRLGTEDAPTPISTLSPSLPGGVRGVGSVEHLAAGTLRVRGAEVPVLAAATSTGALCVWDATTTEEVYLVPTAHWRRPSVLERLSGAGDARGEGRVGCRVSALQLTPFGMLSAGEDGTAKLWLMQPPDEGGAP